MKKTLIILNALVLALTLPLTILAFTLYYTVLQPEFILDTLEDTDSYTRVQKSLDSDLTRDLLVEFSFTDTVSAEWLEDQLTTIVTGMFMLAHTPGSQFQDIEGTLSLAPVKEMPFYALFDEMESNEESVEGTEELPALTPEEEHLKKESMLELRDALPEEVPLNVLVALLAAKADVEPALTYYIENGEYDESIFNDPVLKKVNQDLLRLQAGVETVRIALVVLVLIDIVTLLLIGFLSGTWQRAIRNIGHALWTPGVSILGVGITLWVATVPLRELLLQQAGIEVQELTDVSRSLIQDIIADLLRSVAQPWVITGSILLVISIVSTIIYKIAMQRRRR